MYYTSCVSVLLKKMKGSQIAIQERLMGKISELYEITGTYTISTAESCTGGLLSFYLTSVSGSSKYFKGGIVSYSNEAKIELLKVDQNLISKFTAVSDEVCESMAINCQKLNKTDISVAITGYADFYGGVKESGYVIVGLKILNNEIVLFKNTYSGDRNTNRIQIVENIVDRLIDELHKLYTAVSNPS